MNHATPDERAPHPGPGEIAPEGGIDVTLQISVAPRDAPYAREILPHQLRQWGPQVGEVLLTLDLGSSAQRDASGSVSQRAEIERLLADLCNQHPHARVAQVDYSGTMPQEVSRRCFGGRPVPRWDCFGKVVYPYFFGLLSARNRYVVHMDSDMLFGGGSATWVAEARQLFSQGREVFSCSPLPGPPSERPFPRRIVVGHARSRCRRALATSAVPFERPGLAGPAYRFARVSTRDFMIDRSVLDNGLAARWTRHPTVRDLAATLAKGTIARGDPRYAPAETLLSRVMTARGMIRVDFLGRPPGMWSLHPPSHSAMFHRMLPELVRRVEDGDIPDQQRGEFDLHESMLDPGSSRDQVSPLQ